MKIAFFTDDYLPYVHGVTTSIQNYRQAFEALGHEVWIVAPKPKQKGFVEYDDHVIRLPSVNSYVFDKRPVSLLYPGIARKLDPYDFDIVHSQTQFYLFVIAGMVAKRKNIPHVTTVHTLYTELLDDYPMAVTAGLIAVSIGFPFAFKMRPVLPFSSAKEIRDLPLAEKGDIRKTQGWRLIAAAVNQADAGFVPSEHLSKTLVDYGTTVPLILQTNGIELSRYRTAKASDSPLTKKRGEKFIVCVARVSAEKRQHILIEALAQMKFRSVKLILVGNGPESEHLQTLADQLGIGDQVIFPGLLSATQVAAVLKQSDMFALASYRFDNQPMAILEAIASGLPVVYCDDNLREGLSRDNARLTRGIAAEHFAHVFDDLCTNPDKLQKMSIASRHHAQDFDRKKLARTMVDNYQHLVDGEILPTGKPPRKRLPRVSIVIPAYNEAQVIEKCIDSCMNQTRPAYEIIIVNNKSTDDTEKIVRRLQRRYKTTKTTIRLLQQNRLQGIIPTRDHGMAAAKGDVIGRIDADSTLEPIWVEAVQEGFSDPDVAAASGPVVYHDMPAKNAGFRADNQIRGTLDKLTKEYKFLFGSNMAVRRKVWHEIIDDLCEDVNDEMHEDIDVAFHLHDRGYKVVYLPNMIGGMSARRLEDSPKDFYQYIMRYERTFKYHGVSSRAARIPIFIYLATYFPMKFIRFTYDADEEQFTFERFRDRLTRRHGDSRDDEIVI